jgi:hypothetical protein
MSTEALGIVTRSLVTVIIFRSFTLEVLSTDNRAGQVDDSPWSDAPHRLHILPLLRHPPRHLAIQNCDNDVVIIDEDVARHGIRMGEHDATSWHAQYLLSKFGSLFHLRFHELEPGQ